MVINTNMSVGMSTAGAAMPSKATSTTETEETTSLSEEEKLYDLDGDGKLSTSEEAAYLQAQQQKEAMNSVKKETTVEDVKAIAKEMKSESTSLQAEVLNSLKNTTE